MLLIMTVQGENFHIVYLLGCTGVSHNVSNYNIKKYFIIMLPCVFCLAQPPPPHHTLTNSAAKKYGLFDQISNQVDLGNLQ